MDISKSHTLNRGFFHNKFRVPDQKVTWFSHPGHIETFLSLNRPFSSLVSTLEFVLG